MATNHSLDDSQAPVDEARRLREAVRGATAYRRVQDHEARAHFVLRQHLLERLASALSSCGVAGLLVKGGALALTCYQPPWSREMVDIDVVVRLADQARALPALAREGFQLVPGDARRCLTTNDLSERKLHIHVGTVAHLVEIHSRLDAVVGRPIDYTAILTRATPAAGLPGLWVPSAEDHALLIVLHVSGSDFAHPVAWVDLELLLRAGLDLAIFERRARAWRLTTAAWAVLTALQALGSSSVPPDLVERLRPAALRRLAIGRYYRPQSYPIARGPTPFGLPWVVRQTVLRDDLASWAAGISAYSVKRAVEHGLAAVARAAR